ncbi:unnamed protein product [Ceutorhynchus assimilis]|uniref:Polypeptide N-acetylgalactosaminyltransferase n=1 Tax=Ceutorhynchus assimilis TaxID=467358 RepID=A0A9N9MXW9_9CUCU|nr:unnamed protein product [Ceutorhynchus assimilis]
MKEFKRRDARHRELVLHGSAFSGVNPELTRGKATAFVSRTRVKGALEFYWCKKPGRFLENLPKTSVIICFHNEAWSVLLRTVHSVLDRSPERLIEEVVLVDDFSDMDHLKGQLEDYFSNEPKVKIVRAPKRLGLIRARLIGYEHAKGEVLTYLDSHCECTEGWLEPLLDRIARNSTNVVCPVIDVIDDTTLAYVYHDSTGVNVGGFDWNLQFNWHAVPQHERQRHKDTAEPVWSPTMAGGLFSIDRLPIGKSLGHQPRVKEKQSPGHQPRVKKRMHSAINQECKKDRPPGNDKGDFGDISQRKALRESLQCKSFQWYLDNIYPELFIPGDAVASGEMRNLGYGGKTCLDSAARKSDMHKPVGLYPCHKQGGNQFWLFSKNGEIRRDESCLDYSGQEVILYPCHGSKGNQFWNYDNLTKLIRHGSSDKCMAINVAKTKIVMEHCDSNSSHQRWDMENYDKSKL